MTDSKIREIQEILSGVNAILRRKLEAGIKAGHDLAVLLLEGEVHTAELLAEVGSGPAVERRGDEPLN